MFVFLLGLVVLIVFMLSNSFCRLGYFYFIQVCIAGSRFVYSVSMFHSRTCEDQFNFNALVRTCEILV